MSLDNDQVNAKEEVTFDAAVAEIDNIVKKIQTERSLDSLVDDVRRAKELIEICENRILNTEKELNEILGPESREM